MHLNKSSRSALLCLSLSIAAAALAAAQDGPFSPQAKQKAEDLLKQMTLDEKVGQLDQAAGIIFPGIATEKPDNP